LSINGQPQISIIIPIHNCEKYIGRCIDSILAQTYQDIEILLLDNGSTDGTLAILQEYERNYPELIRVDSHENLGLGNNRNLGIELSKGKYLQFIDADDYVSSDYCETYYNEIEAGGYDVVYGGYIRIDSKGRTLNKTTVKDTVWGKYLLVTPWAKIQRASFIKQNQIAYVGAYGEDITFLLNTFRHTNKIKIIQHTGYNWFYNEESLSNTTYVGLSKEMNDHVITMLDRIDALYESKDDYLIYFMLRACIYYLLRSGKTGTKEDFVNVYTQFTVWFKERCPGFQKNKYLLWGPKSEYFSTNIIVSIFTVICKLHLVPLFARTYCNPKGRTRKY
jgi:glycosyltransferase involved in cell wall biosynthesis